MAGWGLLDSAFSAANKAYEMGVTAYNEVSTKINDALPEGAVGLPGAPGVGQNADGSAAGGASTSAGGAHQNGQMAGKGKEDADGNVVNTEEVENFGRVEIAMDYNFEKQSLAITVIQCEQLPAMDIGGTSDPYVKVYVMPDKKKKFMTKKLKKTLNPVYNETFTFNKLPFNEMSNKTLVLDIFDHDALGADDQIGMVLLPLGNIDLAAENLRWWKDIREPPKNVLGDICVSLRYAPSKRPPQVNIIIIECKNLKAMDIGGASDPYVKINHMVNGRRVKKYKTTVKMADLNPYYNQSFKIEVNPYEMGKTELHLYVMDYDKVGGNDAIGWVSFSLKDDAGSPGNHWRTVLANPKKSIAQWHALQPPPEEK